MEVRLLHGLAEMDRAEGVTVVIDVFRAFSLEPYLYEFGVKKILACGEVFKARELKKLHPDYILIGERGGRKLAGFDFGNSPSTIERALVKDKTVVHTTSAGTRGLSGVMGHCEVVLTGSLVNACSVVKYIKSLNPKVVCLLCMGLNGEKETPEDNLCGAYLRALLLDEEFDLEAGLEAVRKSEEGLKFFNKKTQEVFPVGDFYCCLAVNSLEVVLEAHEVAPGVFECVRVV